MNISLPITLTNFNRQNASSDIATYPVIVTDQRPWCTRLLWEAFSHAAITARRLLVHLYLPLSNARCSFIQLGELKQRGVNKIVQ